MHSNGPFITKTSHAPSRAMVITAVVVLAVAAVAAVAALSVATPPSKDAAKPQATKGKTEAPARYERNDAAIQDMLNVGLSKELVTEVGQPITLKAPIDGMFIIVKIMDPTKSWLMDEKNQLAVSEVQDIPASRMVTFTPAERGVYGLLSYNGDNYHGNSFGAK